MRCREYRKTGQYHTLRGESCQDMTAIQETMTDLFAAAADGATGCRRSGTGAELACRGAADFYEREKERVFEYSDEKLQYLLKEHILYYLERETGARGAELQEYGGTLMTVFSEKDSGRTVATNLGDGCIFLLADGRLRTVLPPKRFGGRPCLTTTEGAERAAETRRFTLQSGASLLLCTDGFLQFLNGEPERRTCLQEALVRWEFGALEQLLEASPEPDDCSYLAFKPETDAVKGAI